jgi:hypothetical protein
MRAYTVATTAVALNVPTKWVDNVLSHHRIPGVSRSRQGVSRKLTYRAILALELALRIARTLTSTLPRSLELAALALADRDAPLSLGNGLSLTIDLGSLESELAGRLDHAVEVTPLPRRGRPAPETRKGRLSAPLSHQAR